LTWVLEPEGGLDGFGVDVDRGFGLQAAEGVDLAGDLVQGVVGRRRGLR
jgi:hypothetical protein